MEKKPEKEKKETMKLCVSGGVRAVLWITSYLCLRLCPWYFECVIVCARYKCRYLVGTGTEAKLLVELLTSWVVLLQSSLDSFDSVRELGHRIKVLL